jgi:hypothetical protein
VGLIGSWVVVWWLGDGEKMMVEEKLGGSSARALREGENEGGGAVRAGRGISLL